MVRVRVRVRVRRDGGPPEDPSPATDPNLDSTQTRKPPASSTRDTGKPNHQTPPPKKKNKPKP